MGPGLSGWSHRSGGTGLEPDAPSSALYPARLRRSAPLAVDLLELKPHRSTPRIQALEGTFFEGGCLELQRSS